MPCKEEEDKVNVSKLNNVKQVLHDITKRKRLKDGMHKGRIAAGS